MKKYSLLLFIVVLISACDFKSSETVKEINLGTHVNDKALGIKLNDIADVIQLIEIGNPDSLLLKRADVECIHDEKLIISGRDVLLAADMNTGKVINSIGGKGNGYGEYLMISSVAVDDVGNVYVCDLNPKRILKYNIGGQFLGNIPCRDASSVAVLPDGNLVVALKSGAKDKSAYVVYNEFGDEIVKSRLERDTLKTEMMYLNSLDRQDGECYFKKALSDTIYQITTDTIAAFCVISPGKYRTPEENYASLDKLKTDSRKYISIQSRTFNSKYMYLCYWLSDSMYMDLWNISENALIARNILEKTSTELIPGFEVEVNGAITNVVPCYMSEKYLICKFLRQEDAEKVYPVTEDTNPLLLVMRFKK